MELVTAVITTCKRDSITVCRAIKSVMQQTYDNIEIIVVDDSPEEYTYRDDVKNAVMALQANTKMPIIYIRHDDCKGACVARNTGLNRANGKFIGFLDDDDEWLPEKVEEMLKGFVSERVALVYCNYEEVNDVTGESRTVTMKEYAKDEVFDHIIRVNFIGSTSFPLLKKSSLEDIGGFDEKMKSAQDADVWIRLAKQYDIAFVDRVLVRYHLHGSDQISKNTKNKIQGLERLNEKNAQYLQANRCTYWVRYMKIIPFYLMNGDQKKAWKCWWTCVKKCPDKFVGNLKYLFRIVFKYTA